MSTVDPKPRKQKQKESRSQSANDAERLKTVVRRLPPNLPEEIFWQSVQEWVTDDTVSWKSYHPGKLRTKRLGKEGLPSRAYIAFKTEALVATFSQAYDGHVFRDKAGNASQAVVEYAPFQKVPAEKRKTDARHGTIDKDDDYLSFLAVLQGHKTESTSLDALVAASQSPPPPTTTPLLEALKAEKSAQRDKEAILRNHAHYKDGASKKEEGKKKAVRVDPPAAAAGKKSKKAAQEQGAKGASSAKPVPSAAPSASGSLPAPAPARHRPPKEAPPHGRSHAKGDAPAAPASSTPTPAPAPGPSTAPSAPPTSATEAPPAALPHVQRKHRPVIGLGRQLEAALSGAGVGVSQSAGVGVGDRKRRDKEEGGAGVASGTELVGGKGKQKHRERVHPPEAVPSILQRPVEAGPEVVAARPLSREGHAEPAPGGKGPPRRGRGRGRGGHRGG